MEVVLVHGFLDTGRLFDDLSARLGAAGHACRAPTLEPRDGRLGIPDLSRKLASFIDGYVGAGAPLALIGFSMGALVCRHYIQALAGERRVCAFFSIAGPHAGTPTAYFYPGGGTRDMRPGSAFLGALGQPSDRLAAMPVITYRTPFDLMVMPPSTTRIAGATEVVVPSLLHSMMPASPRLAAHIAAALGRIGPGPAGR